MLSGANVGEFGYSSHTPPVAPLSGSVDDDDDDECVVFES